MPEKLKFTNHSIAWINGNENSDEVYGHFEKSILLLEGMSYETGMISVVVYNIPNCPIHFKTDSWFRPTCEN